MSNLTPSPTVKVYRPGDLMPLNDNTAQAKRIGFANWVSIALAEEIDTQVNARFDDDNLVYTIYDDSETIGFRVDTFNSNNICKIIFEYLTPDEMKQEDIKMLVFGDYTRYYYLRVKVTGNKWETTDDTVFTIVVAFPHSHNTKYIVELADFLFNVVLENVIATTIIHD